MILSGGRLPVLVPDLVQLLVAVLVVEASTLLEYDSEEEPCLLSDI